MQKYLFIALALGLSLIAFIAFQEAKPSSKSPIYQTIKPYSPYYLEKCFGGLQIMSKTDPEFKEKPNNMEIFHRLEFLEKRWGKSHLKIQADQLMILDQNGSTQATIPIKSQQDRDFLQYYYGVSS